MYRHSLLFQFKHGDHTCIFYRNEDSLREVLTPYIADGLRRGERCFCAQKPHVCNQLVADLQFLGIDCEAAIRRGALQLHTVDKVYFPNKTFDSVAMMDLLLQSTEDACRAGYAALRIAGDLSWAPEGTPGSDQLIAYERLVDEVFPGRSIIGLCQYDMTAFQPRILDAAIEAHRLHMSNGSPGSFHTGIVVRTRNCWTEIVADKLIVAPVYYYVVQQRQSREVLGWGIAPTFDLASERADRIARTANN